MLNTMDLQILAGKALDDWRKYHDSGCVLYVEGDCVVARSLDYQPSTGRSFALITKLQAQKGFSSAGWSKLGERLYEIYMENKK